MSGPATATITVGREDRPSPTNDTDFTTSLLFDIQCPELQPSSIADAVTHSTSNIIVQWDLSPTNSLAIELSQQGRPIQFYVFNPASSSFNLIPIGSFFGAGIDVALTADGVQAKEGGRFRLLVTGLTTSFVAQFSNATVDMKFYNSLAQQVAIGTATIPDNGNASFPACPVGTGYGENLPGEGAGAGSCAICDAGVGAMAPGVCAVCQPGTHRVVVLSVTEEITQTTCEPCPAGTFAAISGQETCTPCPLGSFADGVGNMTCTLCPATYTTRHEGAQAADSCMCAPGTRMSLYGDGRPEECLPCLEAGTYSDTENAQECKSCPAGKFVPEDTSELQLGNTVCAPCPLGKYQDHAGKATCMNCEPGAFAARTGSTECTLCAPGFYADQFASLQCEPCHAGSRAPFQGANTCLTCGAGVYQDETGSAVCKLCPAGTYNDESGITRVEDCLAFEPGFYGVQGGLTSEGGLACPQGTFAESSGSTECTECPAGTYNEITQSTSVSACLRCAPGSFSAALGAATAEACTSCNPGSFAEAEGSTACVLCDPGTAQGSAGAASCEACEPGSYQESSGQTSCILCPVGTFASSNQSTSCTICPQGTTSALGSTSLEDCVEPSTTPPPPSPPSPSPSLASNPVWLWLSLLALPMLLVVICALTLTVRRFRARASACNDADAIPVSL